MRAIELYKEQGVAGLAGGVSRYVKYQVCLRTIDFIRSPIIRYIEVPRIIKDIKGYGHGPVEAMQCVYSHKALRPQQKRSEIWALIKTIHQQNPRNILEIGTANGGTLFLFTRSTYANVVSIDLPGGRFGGGYPSWKLPLYDSFTSPGQKLQLIRGDSHNPNTLECVKAITGGIDFLWIDGDHTYAGVKKDCEMYGPLVNDGGIIAFHDIVEHPKETGCEVNRFWNEIKQEYRHEEIVEDWKQGSCGIGVLYV